MKNVFVTGAGAGLGAAIAAAMAKDGWRVGVFDRDGDNARSVAAGLPNAVAFQGDVTDEAQIENAIEAFGEPLDGLVSNAGVVRFGPLLEQSTEEIRNVLNINLFGAFLAARAAGRRMVARGEGAIVNITSINALTPAPDCGAYPAAKAGLAHWTRHMALEWGPRGVRVNAVAPGFIDGGMSAPIYANPKVRAARSGGVPLRSLGHVDDVAEAVSFLLSDKAKYVNGHELVVDGGVVTAVLAALPRE
ncbi:MAG: SDR family oxidoreductase [Caulobacterales bacterium]|nr:SDR family oxidoreductase [Caulobacterales bacterium]